MSRRRAGAIFAADLYSPYLFRLKLTFSIEDLDNPPDTSDLTANEDGAEEPENTFPIRCSLSITKPSGGSLVMDLLVENEAFVIDSAQFYSDAKLAEDMTAEGDWKRRATYVGPRKSWLESLHYQCDTESYISMGQALITLTAPCRPSSRTTWTSELSTRLWVSLHRPGRPNRWLINAWNVSHL